MRRQLNKYNMYYPNVSAYSVCDKLNLQSLATCLILTERVYQIDRYHDNSTHCFAISNVRSKCENFVNCQFTSLCTVISMSN